MKDTNTPLKNKKIESQLAVQSTVLAESIIDALVSTLLGPYLHFKASKLRNTKEYKNVQKKIKELDAEYEGLLKAQEKLSDASEEATRKGKQAFYNDVDSKFRKAFPKLNTKPLKPTKRL
jgi:hypothetical protein